MRASNFMWAALTIAVGVALFLVKHKVQELEHQLVAKQALIVRDQGEIRVLQAEWTYLNDPERLRRQSEEHLGFHPLGPQNVTTIAALPFRESNPATTPQDNTPEVDFKATPATPPTPRGPPSPQLHAENQDPQMQAGALLRTASTQRPSIFSATFARLQRLLLPTAAGATIPKDDR